MKSKNLKLIAVTALTISFTACSSGSFGAISPNETGYFELRGDAKGLEAYSQGLHGLIEGAKTKDGSAKIVATTYQRKAIERTTRKIRYVSPMSRLVDSLTGGAEK